MLCSNCGRSEEEGAGWVLESRYSDGSGRFARHEECPEKVCKKLTARSGGYSFDPCSRDAVEHTDGGWLCKRHLSAFNRRKKNSQAFVDVLAESETKKTSAEASIQLLLKYGVKATPEYYRAFNIKHSGFTGQIIVSPEELLEVLSRAD